VRSRHSRISVPPGNSRRRSNTAEAIKLFLPFGLNKKVYVTTRLALSLRHKRPNDFHKHLQVPAKYRRAPLQYDANPESSVRQKDDSGILRKPYPAPAKTSIRPSSWCRSNFCKLFISAYDTSSTHSCG
jgi:hypothetical protein